MSRCPNALTCHHVATLPTGDYLHLRGRLFESSILRGFAGWPTYHLAAIVRARVERGGD